MATLITKNYPIYFDAVFEELNAFLNKKKYSKIFILVDSNTSIHCLPILNFNLEGLKKYDIVEVDSGETSKNIDIAIGVWRTLLDFEADKNSLLINLGGGMICDLGGFCAASFMRGIDFVNIPTSLLAQVDASVGGKTAIDLEDYKNIIGFFAYPQAVFIDEVFLETLPGREKLSGHAEIIKHGLIADKQYYHEFIKALQNSDINYAGIIEHSVQLKNSIVETDPYDKGIRKTLNFGHTIGHAIESFSMQENNKALLHGEAVLLGMLAEAFISKEIKLLSVQNFIQIEKTLLDLLPPISFKQENFESILHFMKRDKKNNGASLLFVLLTNIGQSSYDQEVSEDLVLDALNYLLSTSKK